MLDGTLLFIAAVFTLAGLVKGVIGLGLPTIAMGLLAIVMPPVEAAAILLVPSFLTNVWQMVDGRALGRLTTRLFPMLLTACVVTYAGIGMMTGLTARVGTAVLGAALVLYALSGLAAWRPTVPRDGERWIGLLTGIVTGLMTAATGVFVIPVVPYLQALGLEKDELVQALGLSFTVSTVALAVSLGASGALSVVHAIPTAVALAVACAGMAAGQALRARLAPETFRRWFFIGLLGLGAYLVARAL